ncbi:MAG: serine/threonine protein kinase [Chloroflexi bacterium]|nr:serine/threonine protein kinase [Chloroflexota bacterium]MCI0644252.1 serine/threonine protein kinase [Chloroflexota bacterium]
MAKVYLARDPLIKRQVAIKVLSQQFVSDPLFLINFQREAEVIASLEHPCIVPVFDFGEHQGQPYIVMRYMAGGSLEERLKKEKMRPHRLSQVIGRVAEALDAAHGKSIIHRDVKPNNILFEDSDKAFLSDFGLARWLQHPSGTTGAYFMGTPEYMSPEQARNEDLDGRSDVYALGVVLFYSLAGRLPFSNPSPMATALAQVIEPVPDILAINPDLSSHWVDIVLKALAKEPADRYGTAGDLARAVRDVASGRWYLSKL